MGAQRADGEVARQAERLLPLIARLDIEAAGPPGGKVERLDIDIVEAGIGIVEAEAATEGLIAVIAELDDLLCRQAGDDALQLDVIIVERQAEARQPGGRASTMPISVLRAISGFRFGLPMVFWNA